MKKFFISSLLMSAGLLCTLTSCGFSDKSEITQNTDTFFQAAMDGDYNAVSSLAAAEVIDSMGLNALDIDSACGHYYEHHNIDASLLSEDAKNSVKDYCTYFANGLIQDYQIQNISSQNGFATLDVSVTTYSPKAAEYMDSDAFLDELETLMTEYQNEHIEELSSIYLKDGDKAMEQTFYNAVIPLIMEHYKTTLSRFGTEEIILTMTLEKQNDTWLITQCGQKNP